MTKKCFSVTSTTASSNTSRNLHLFKSIIKTDVRSRVKLSDHNLLTCLSSVLSAAQRSVWSSSLRRQTLFLHGFYSISCRVSTRIHPPPAAEVQKELSTTPSHSWANQGSRRSVQQYFLFNTHTPLCSTLTCCHLRMVATSTSRWGGDSMRLIKDKLKMPCWH